MLTARRARVSFLGLDLICHHEVQTGHDLALQLPQFSLPAVTAKPFQVADT